MRARQPRDVGPVRRCRGEQGSVIVESAFMLPFLFALLFGIIDFGFAFNDWISVRQGGRDGLRQLIVNTNPTPPSGGWNCPAGAGAPATGTTGYAMMCFTKLRVGLDQNKTAVKVFYSGTYAASTPVKLCVQYKTSSLTGAYGAILNNRVLDTEVETLIESATPTISSFAETTFPDGTAVNWAASCNQL